ncbi:uncharacterized protein FIESC28_04106 [Fusarium coffeatum]|uniref:Uncharacterized protein n=1 Tax=Fusarium coffeatum TaxID=231269 RepID=A0A366S1D4_9HYPO|nr:uncharacterized protein FIESC28_04106 [Fusarium coffeatum]RBR23111.1 hypothetical protein FIESC28_04106 [Fusarium coffeatum]
MSGLEVLGAVASSIALVQAVKGTLKAVDFLRQNSEMKKQCNNLRREQILIIEYFIMQAQQQTCQTNPAQQLLGSAEHPLVSLATEELEDILKELNEIVEKYSHSRKAHDPKRYTDKMKWFTEASKIEELCDRAQATKSNLHMAITFRVSSMVDRGNMRQEVLFHRVTQQLTSYTHGYFNEQKSLNGIPETSYTIARQHRVQELEEQGMVVSSRSNKGKFDAQGASPSGESNYTALTTKEETFMSVTTVQPLEKLSSLIPDWDEDRTTDIHLEAANPEGTADGMLKALQKEPWAIDEQDECGMCPIHHAVREGNSEALVLLIMAGANINQRCGLGHTPLLWSVSHRQEEATKKLLEYEDCRIHVNDLVLNGATVIHYAIGRSFPAGVRMLLEAGAMTKLPRTPIYTPPIMHILGSETDQESVDEIADLLLMHGADLEERDIDSRTPIISAITCRSILALRKLVSAGASLKAMTSINHNILHSAAFAADVEILDYITKLDLTGVQVTQRATNGDNPLRVLYLTWSRPFWRVTKHQPQLSSAAIEAVITFYFDLLIPELRRHISTIDMLLQAVKDRDSSTATGILDQLIEKNVKCGEPDLVGWYRGLKGYVFGGDWDHLADVLEEEYDETDEKIERARIARGKAITDPEMEEFF